MAKIKTDELNILSTSDDFFDYEDFIDHYFDSMQISEQQKKKRIEAAEELFDIILFFLSWIEEFEEQVQAEDVQRQFENDYKEVVYQYGEPDNYFARYVPLFINNLIQTTLDHIGEEYFTSVERASYIACNESNSVINHTELQQAIENGYKYKVWNTEKDERVRHTHMALEGITIPINEAFHVGQYLMMMPHDSSLGAGAEEIVNCRCVLSYKDRYIDLDLQFFADKSKHAVYRQNQRKISDEDIQEALDNPLDDPYNYYEDDDMGGKIKYIGEKTTVVVNAENGNIITTFATPPYLAKRLKNGI